MKWTTPSGPRYDLYADMLQQSHLLIAVATGSGKSVVLNALIYTALYKAPSEVSFILADPKMVELYRYAKLPHVLRYAAPLWARHLQNAGRNRHLGTSDGPAGGHRRADQVVDKSKRRLSSPPVQISLKVDCGNGNHVL